MKLRALVFGSALALGALGVPVAGWAHTKVIASTPAEGALVAGPKVVTLSFSEALLPPTVNVSIVMTAMPGMANHGEMVIRNFTPAWSEGNRKLTLNLRQPLRAGTYEVRWQAAGTDGHRMSGKITFQVK